MNSTAQQAPTKFYYSSWRHGGWYVENVRYVTGAVGCVSRNYPDKKWRIVCDPRPDAYERYTYKTRDEAALAEWQLTRHPDKIREGIEDCRKTQAGYLERGTDPTSRVVTQFDDRIARAEALLQEVGAA